jgi:hypothetical protein
MENYFFGKNTLLKSSFGKNILGNSLVRTVPLVRILYRKLFLMQLRTTFTPLVRIIENFW